MKTLMGILMSVVVLVSIGVGSVKGALVIDDPEDLMGGTSSQGMEMPLGDSLMERVGGVDVIPNKGTGEYYFLFGKYVSGGLVFAAYVDTDNFNSNNYSGYEVWCQGRIDRDVFGDDEGPDYVLAIYDDDGGQFALSYSSGELVFDSNIIAWESGDNFIPGSGEIEYDGVVGGFTSMSFGVIGSIPVYLDSVVLIPEAATVLLLVFGSLVALRKRRR